MTCAEACVCMSGDSCENPFKVSLDIYSSEEDDHPSPIIPRSCHILGKKVTVQQQNVVVLFQPEKLAWLYLMDHN